MTEHTGLSLLQRFSTIPWHMTGWFMGKQVQARNDMLFDLAQNLILFVGLSCIDQNYNDIYCMS